jgi:uncharacterized protein YndB with AHSA1/START domain
MLPILLALAFIAILFIVVIAGQPGEFKISRSAKISAPPENVFPHVNDFHKWEAWSPWAKMDPACKNTFAGPPAGAGAIFSWAGNRKVGEGRMTILESRPGARICIQLEFFKPFKAINTAEFLFQPEANQTLVTWSMSGQNNFMGRVFGLIVNCEKLVGRDFEKGLAALKAVTEMAGRS